MRIFVDHDQDVWIEDENTGLFHCADAVETEADLRAEWGGVEWKPAPTDHTAAIAEAAREYVAAVHAKDRATSAYEDAIDARNTSGRAIHPNHAREDQLQQAVYAASHALTTAKGRAAQTRLALIDLVDAERAERGQS